MKTPARWITACPYVDEDGDCDDSCSKEKIRVCLWSRSKYKTVCHYDFTCNEECYEEVEGECGWIEGISYNQRMMNGEV